MRIIALLFLFLATGLLKSKAQNFTWARQAGYHSSEMAHAVSADAAGNAYITGEMSPQTVFDNITFGGSFIEGFLAKYDPSGNLIWAKNITGPDTETPYHLHSDLAGNSYVTGTFNQTASFGPFSITASSGYDAFLAKYDTYGNEVWVRKTSGPSAEYGSGVFADESGNVIVCGAFYQSVSFGSQNLSSSGMDDIFLAMYDSSGGLQWAVRAGGAGADYANDVKIRNGLIYVTGSFQQTAYFGTASVVSNGHYDIFVACYDMSGNLMWCRSAGSSEFVGEAGAAVESDQNGNVFICGSVGGTASFGSHTITSNGGGSYVDAFIAAYDSQGTCLWVRNGGGIIADGGISLTIDPAGLVYMTGSYNAVATFDSLQLQPIGQSADIFLACYDQAGNIQWLKNAGGGAGPDAGEGVCYDNNGGLYLAGFFYRTAYFDAISLPFIHQERNIFIARFDLPGTVGMNESPAVAYDPFSIFPNPASEILNIILPETGQVMIQIFDTQGMLVHEIRNLTSAGQISTDISQLSPGIYYCRVISGLDTNHRSFVVIN